MKDTKIIVFDVGNTLIDTKKGKLSNQLFNDLNRLRNKGYILGISTLRTEDMMQDILSKFQFDFMILANGGLVKIKDKVKYDMPIDNKILSDLLNIAINNNIELKRYKYDNKVYALEFINAKDKIMCNNNYNYYIWDNSGNIDITAIGVNKYNSIKLVCNEFDVKLDNVMAFGDGYNDIDILQNVGTSVVMNGAPKQLLDIADLVTKTAVEDGISYALRRMNIL